MHMHYIKVMKRTQHFKNNVIVERSLLHIWDIRVRVSAEESVLRISVPFPRPANLFSNYLPVTIPTIILHGKLHKLNLYS
jgi:hypothetical protein